jgi:hypothetical protein
MTIGGSIALIVIGAILRSAVNWSPAHVNVPLIGLILMVGGAIELIISLVFLMRRRASAPVGGGLPAAQVHRGSGPYAEPPDRYTEPSGRSIEPPA